jgi:hypothetical protein
MNRPHCDYDYPCNFRLRSQCCHANKSPGQCPIEGTRWQNPLTTERPSGIVSLLVVADSHAQPSSASIES